MRQHRSAPEAGARLLWKADVGKAVSARHIQQRMPRWKVYAVRLLSTTSGAPAADTRTATTAQQDVHDHKHDGSRVRPTGQWHIFAVVHRAPCYIHAWRPNITNLVTPGALACSLSAGQHMCRRAPTR